jgi:hypothetical protein
MKTTIKNKQSALDAAQELIKAEQQKKVETASKDLDVLIGNWSKKHNCSLVISGQFQGNQIKSNIQVVING